MNKYAWEEALLSTMYYLDQGHSIFECITKGPNFGKLKFSDYSPWGCQQSVLDYHFNRGYACYKYWRVNDLCFKKYYLLPYGKIVFHWGEEI